MHHSIFTARTSGPAQQNDGAKLFEFNFSARDDVFAGHFPGRPILPGIFQIEIARAAAEWACDRRFAVNEISKSKFQRPILPDEPLKLELKLTETDDMVSARANFSVNGEPAGETLLQLRQCD
ncbi:MAG TPA: hypothetical protein VFV23_12085 [Verrucomicrobiae bacterium]|nr:hypothetical protein [Verrucomicrobiae bacterium]